MLALFLFLATGVILQQGNIALQRGPILEDTTQIPVTGELLIGPNGVWDDLLDIFASTKYNLQMRIYQASYPEALQLLSNL
ncbi:MAG: hypothetical protein H6765_02615 [Candidatus Peribacteria bacterium]|nr:MAG: hypothetical protein H6765_02615 [Candidatus Peribacteria bacterium]